MRADLLTCPLEQIPPGTKFMSLDAQGQPVSLLEIRNVVVVPASPGETPPDPPHRFFSLTRYLEGGETQELTSTVKGPKVVDLLVEEPQVVDDGFANDTPAAEAPAPQVPEAPAAPPVAPAPEPAPVAPVAETQAPVAAPEPPTAPAQEEVAPPEPGLQAIDLDLLPNLLQGMFGGQGKVSHRAINTALKEAGWDYNSLSTQQKQAAVEACGAQWETYNVVFTAAPVATPGLTPPVVPPPMADPPIVDPHDDGVPPEEEETPAREFTEEEKAEARAAQLQEEAEAGLTQALAKDVEPVVADEPRARRKVVEMANIEGVSMMCISGKGVAVNVPAALFSGDFESYANGLKALHGSGLLTKDEARGLLGL